MTRHDRYLMELRRLAEDRDIELELAREKCQIAYDKAFEQADATIRNRYEAAAEKLYKRYGRS